MSAEENKALVLRRLHSGVLRLRSGWLPILQTAVAACLAWFLAVLLLGLERPTFAPIAAVIVLGVAGRGGGPRGGGGAPPGALRGAAGGPPLCPVWEIWRGAWGGKGERSGGA